MDMSYAGRLPNNTNSPQLIIDGKVYKDDEQIQEACADYFEDFTAPGNHETFNDEQFNIVEINIISLTGLFLESKVNSIENVAKDKVEIVIPSFKNGKSLLKIIYLQNILNMNMKRYK